ncbi:MAG: hypothetical protein U1F68_05470 [Gammaproteobacteria bacterium]
MAAGKGLQLIIPGLLGPWPEAAVNPAFPLPRAPALTRLLNRATARPASRGFEATLCHLFGLPLPTDQDLPVAALTRLADGGQADERRYWLRADPVHLRADLRQVLLVDARHLAIQASEAQALVDECNRFFADEEWRLEARHPHRWYLGLRTKPELRTTPLADAIGKSIDPLLPMGLDRRRWHGFLTEIQMLLHASPVNHAREAQDRPAINGVWLWGGGALPATAQAPAAGIYADEPLCRGLARLAGTAIHPVPANADEWLGAASAEAESLVVLDQARFDRADDEPERWQAHLEALEHNWLTPCHTLLKRRKIAYFTLDPCTGTVYHISARQSRYFWRGQRPLPAFLVNF